MIKTPSKFLSRTFLKRLIQDNFVTESGLEYCEESVKELLWLKDKALSSRQYVTEIKNEFDQARHLELCEASSGIIKGSNKSLSTNYAPSFISCDTIFSLNKLPSRCHKGSATQTDNQFRTKQRIGAGVMNRAPIDYKSKTPKGNKMKFLGHEVRGKAKNYTLSQIKKDIKRHARIMENINQLQTEAINAGHSRTSQSFAC